MFSKVELPRPQERRSVAGAFLTLFGILAGHTLLETARDALFLAKLPVDHLPWVYMAIAVLAFAAVPGRGRGRRWSPTQALSAILVGAAAFTATLWLVTRITQENWTFYVLYVWTGIFGTVSLVQFWLLMGEAFTVTQAKRLFGFIGSGSILGAVAGAGSAWLLVRLVPVRDLILTSACIFLVCGVGVAALGPRRAVAKGRTAAVEIGDFTDAMRILRANPYFRRLLRLILLATVAVTTADYLFKLVVDARVDHDQLGVFFAKVYVGLNLLALVVQVLLVGWILRVFGVHRAQWLLPTCLASASLLLLGGGGLGAALFLKGADGSLRHSLHRTSTELLYLPISDSQRKFFKPLIDVLGQRGGQALASLGILVTVALGLPHHVLLVALVLVSLWWILTAKRLQEPYFDMFRETLRTGALDTRGPGPELDLGSLEAIFSAFNSRDDAEVLAALDLLGEQRRVRLIPALVLYHPSRQVVIRALDLFVQEGRTDFIPVADRVMAHPDPEVRAAALRARQTMLPDDTLLRAARQDESALVRATALVGLIHDDVIQEEERAVLEGILAGGNDEECIALARAIYDNPRPVFSDIMLRLAETDSDNVRLRRVLAGAMGQIRDEAFLPVLVRMLERRELRDDARNALLAFGHVALHYLADALADENVPNGVRRHLPRTISRFEPNVASRILLARFLEEKDGVVRFKILRGLGRLRSDNPRLALDGTLLAEAVDRALDNIFRLLGWRVALELGAEELAVRRTAGHELLVSILRDKERHALERLFRLLGLFHVGENFERMWRGMHSGDAKLRASSHELLENVLEPPWNEPILALVADVTDVERLGLAGRGETIAGYNEVLEAMLDGRSESIRCFAAYHVGELGVTAMRPHLEAVRGSAPSYVSQVIEQALGMLTLRREPAHG